MNRSNKRLTIYTTLIFTLLFQLTLFSQNSMVGDGFGGRLWYKPYNYTVGSYSAYTVCGDSLQLYGWGSNTKGQLGNGTMNSTDLPIKVSGMNQVKYYSTGYLMGAIRKDNTGWIWGNGTSKNPVKVIDSVCFLDAGISVCIFVKSDGTVWSTGNNFNGLFGNNQTNNSSSNIPEQMTGVKNAVRASNSAFSNLVLLSDGTLVTCGENNYGILGISAPDNYSTKKAIPIPDISNIVDIKSNVYNHIALAGNGDVYAWGFGGNGCNGNGFDNNLYTPQKISSLKNIVAISGCNDGDHFLALDADHNCYAWGFINRTTKANTPFIIAKDVNDIMAGETFSYIVKTNGSLWASGFSNGGSIWLNLNNQYRDVFTEIDPTISPLNLCKPESKEIKYGAVNFIICEGDSILIGLNTYKKQGKFICDTRHFGTYDSVTVANLTVLAKTYSTRKYIVCSRESVKAGQHFYKDEGTFTDTIPNYLGCDSIITTIVTHKPNSGSVHHYNICLGESVKVGLHTYKNAGSFYDTFINSLGCDSVITSNIQTGCNFKLFNVFTPDKDSINDVFEIIGPENLQYNLSVYNRWGEVVFETINAPIEDKTQFWNGRLMNKGKECTSGTYYYLFDPKDQLNKKINGVVELIR